MKTDNKVAVIGKVVDLGESSFTVEDETGKTEIFSDQKVATEEVVRAFCNIVEGKLHSDIVQKLQNLDINLFKKIEELYNRAGL